MKTVVLELLLVALMMEFKIGFGEIVGPPQMSESSTHLVYPKDT